MNPVLREGNSDRRAPLSVKNYARKHPHKMGAWSADSKSHVAHMTQGDFYGSEKAALIEADDSLRIELVGKDGSTTVLKEKKPPSRPPKSSTAHHEPQGPESLHRRADR